MNQEKILKRIIQWGASIILLAPLLVNSNFLFPYIHMKNLSFRLIVSALIVLLVWYVFKTGSLRGKKNYVLYALGVLWFIHLVATIFGINPYNSIWGNYERMDGLLHLGLLVLYFWILINVFTKKEDWVWILRVSILGAVLVSLYGLLQTFGVENSLILKASSIRISATIGNPAFLASYLMFNLFFVGLLIHWDRIIQWRVLYALVGLLFILMIYHTGTRGPVIGLVASIFVMGGYYSLRASRKGRIAVVGVFLCIILFGGLLYSQRDSQWIKSYHAFDRIAHISLKDSTTKDRLLTWKTSWEAYTDRPILGYGPENYRYGFNKYYNPNLEEQWFDRAHDVIFDYLNSAGMLGLLAYLATLGAAVYYLWKQRKKDFIASVLMLGLLVAYFIQNLFVFDTLNTFLPLMVTLALSRYLGQQNEDEENEWHLSDSTRAFGTIVAGSLLIIVIIFDYVAFIKPARANVTTIEAYKNTAVAPEKALDTFIEALEYNTFGNREIALQLNSFAMNVVRDDKQIRDLKDRAFQEADKWMTALLDYSPEDIQVRMLLAGLYQQYAGLDSTYIQKSIDLLEPHISDSPERLELYYTIAQGYLQLGQVDKAIELLQKTYDITNKKKTVYVNLMNIYAQTKNVVELDKYANEMIGKIEMTADDYYKIAKFYYIAGDLGKSLQTIDESIQLEPATFQYWQVKVSILRDLGRYDEAILVLTNLAKQNPSWSQTIQSYIDQLEKEKAEL